MFFWWINWMMISEGSAGGAETGKYDQGQRNEQAHSRTGQTRKHRPEHRNSTAFQGLVFPLNTERRQQRRPSGIAAGTGRKEMINYRAPDL